MEICFTVKNNLTFLSSGYISRYSSIYMVKINSHLKTNDKTSISKQNYIIDQEGIALSLEHETPLSIFWETLSGVNMRLNGYGLKIPMVTLIFYY